MKLHGSIIVIICWFLLQFANLVQKRYTFSLRTIFYDIFVVCIQGLTLLLYPLLGHLADVYLTRYRTLKCGLVILVTVGVIAVLFFTIIRLYIIVSNGVQSVIASLIGIGATIGIGLFESNAIQFGLDQLLEAPTPKLISFIHWYYWSQHVGELVVFYIVYIGSFAKLEVCLESESFKVKTKIVSITAFLVILLVTVTTLVLFCVSKKHFYIQGAGLNPFKNIYRVSQICLEAQGSRASQCLSPTGRRIFHFVLTWVRTSMEDHLPLRRWRTPRRSYASYHSSCVSLDTI